MKDVDEDGDDMRTLTSSPVKGTKKGRRYL